MTHYLPDFPSGRLQRLNAETELQLRSFRASLENLGRAPAARPRHVPPAIEAEARKLLAAVARLMARETHWRGRLRLAATPGWAELSVALGFADAALQRFSALYNPDPLDDDEDADSGSAGGLDSSRFVPLVSRYLPTGPVA